MQNCNSKFKITFFGGSSYVIPIIDTIKQDLSLIVTTEKAPNEPVISFCETNKLPYFSISSFEDNLKSVILNLKSPLAIVASFGLMLPSELLNSFEYGALNIHPSLLPKYRGATPVQSAILNGDKTTGVSVIKLDEKMDHGPILARQEIRIDNDETADKLYLRLFKIGAELLSRNVKSYMESSLKLIAQDDAKATYVEPLSRDSGSFNLDSPPNKDVIDRMIRAYFPWPGVWTTIRIMNKELRIKFLPNKMLQVEGKKPINLKDFQNGYPDVFEKIEKLF
jgi:methionyl-tRNA formyltransferase